MPKQKRIEPESFLPTEIEAHFGEVVDPRGHEAEIQNAVQLLNRFCQDLSAASMEEVQGAVAVLGNYSGYPKEAHDFESYLDSDHAKASYRRVAEMLPQFIESMTHRIETRAALLSSQEKTPQSRSALQADEDDPPF